MNEPKQVPEPSAEDAMSHYTDPADPFWQSHPEPQGERSDARAKVIDALVMTRLSDFAGTDMGVIEQAADAVLAALRAASAVTEQGENR